MLINLGGKCSIKSLKELKTDGADLCRDVVQEKNFSKDASVEELSSSTSAEV